MPRDETRPILWKLHADIRLVERGISRNEAETILRSGAWHRNGEGHDAEPKWAAEGSILGQHVRVIFVEGTKTEGKGENQTVIEVLWVITAMVLTKRKRR